VRKATCAQILTCGKRVGHPCSRGSGSNGTENPGKRRVGDAGTKTAQLWNGLKFSFSDSSRLRKPVALEWECATVFCNEKAWDFSLLQSDT